MTEREKLLEDLHYLQSLRAVVNEPPPAPTRYLTISRSPPLEKIMHLLTLYREHVDQITHEDSSSSNNNTYSNYNNNGNLNSVSTSAGSGGASLSTTPPNNAIHMLSRSPGRSFIEDFHAKASFSSHGSGGGHTLLFTQMSHQSFSMNSGPSMSLQHLGSFSEAEEFIKMILSEDVNQHHHQLPAATTPFQAIIRSEKKPSSTTSSMKYGNKTPSVRGGGGDGGDAMTGADVDVWNNTAKNAQTSNAQINRGTPWKKVNNPRSNFIQQNLHRTAAQRTTTTTSNGSSRQDYLDLYSETSMSQPSSPYPEDGFDSRNYAEVSNNLQSAFDNSAQDTIQLSSSLRDALKAADPHTSSDTTSTSPSRRRRDSSSSNSQNQITYRNLLGAPSLKFRADYEE